MFISESGIGMHASNVTAVAYGGGRFPERDEAKHRGESTVEYCSKGQVRGNKTAKGSRGKTPLRRSRKGEFSYCYNTYQL